MAKVKCVCIQACRPKLDDGSRRWFMLGEVWDFEEKNIPVHFEPMEARKIDFQTASEDELLASRWKKSDAAAFIEEKGGKFKDYDGLDKAGIVKQILDARFREV